MAHDFTDLCERIRQHCQQRGWYGSDVQHGFWVKHGLWVPYPDVGSYGYRAELDAITEPPLERFARAPATVKQIAQTEQAIGRELPAALRAIYLSVANGGFGPGEGLEDVSSLSLVRGPHGTWQLPEQIARYLERHPHRYLEFEYEQVPDGLVQLCTWDRECGPDSMQDLNSGRVYGLNNASFYNDKIIGFDWIDFQAASVEDWFEQWLAGALECPFEHLEGSEGPPEERDAAR